MDTTRMILGSGLGILRSERGIREQLLIKELCPPADPGVSGAVTGRYEGHVIAVLNEKHPPGVAQMIMIQNEYVRRLAALERAAALERRERG